MTTCKIQHPQINALLQSIQSILNDHPNQCYNPKTNTGTIRSLQIRHTSFENKSFIQLIITSPNNTLDTIITKISNLPTVTGVSCIIHNDQPDQEPDSMIGKDSITEIIGPYTFKMSSRSFFKQIQSKQSIYIS